jgi:trimeric autotransporter adhesin
MLAAAREDDKPGTTAAATATGNSSSAAANSGASGGSSSTAVVAIGAAAAAAAGATTQASELPHCTTYFYHRWMWIQFPWVALANCGENYTRGIEVRCAVERGGLGGKGGGGSSVTSSSHGKQQHGGATKSSNGGASHGGGFGTAELHRGKPGLLSDEHAAGNSSSNSKVAKQQEQQQQRHTVAGSGARLLPDIGGTTGSSGSINGGGDAKSTALVAAAPRRHSAPQHNSSSSADADADYWPRLVASIHAEIAAARGDLNALVTRRTAAARSLAAAADEALELGLSAGTKASAEGRAAALRAEEDRVTAGHARAVALAKNYRALLSMCQRHPAHSRALIAELEAKLQQDGRLVAEARVNCICVCVFV